MPHPLLQATTVFVLADDANGAPTILRSRVDVTRHEYAQGVHYDRACAQAAADGYANCRAFDENDPAGKTLQVAAAERAVLEDLAATPMEGEPCDSAKDGRQSWVDQAHVYGRLCDLIRAGRQALGRPARLRKLRA